MSRTLRRLTSNLTNGDREYRLLVVINTHRSVPRLFSNYMLPYRTAIDERHGRISSDVILYRNQKLRTRCSDALVYVLHPSSYFSDRSEK